MLTSRMQPQATGSVKENPAECSIGDWVLATGSNIEVQWLKEDDQNADEIEINYADQPDRHDKFRKAKNTVDFGDVWVRVE